MWGLLDRTARRLEPRRRSGLVLLLAAALYAGSTELSELWKIGGATPLWLPLGVGYGVLAVCGRQVVLPIAAVAAVFSLAESRGLWQTAVVTAGAALSILAIDEVTTRLGRAHGVRPIDTLVRTLAGLAGAATGALAFVVAEQAWSRYGYALLGQFAGVLVTAPFLRSWLRRGCLGISRRELAATLATTFVIVEIVSSGALGAGTPLSYLMFPPVVWAALRLGRRGVGAVSFLTAVVAVSNVAYLRGPFGASSDPALTLDAFLVVMTLTGLLLAGVQTTLRRSEERFRALIENATDVVGIFGPDGTIRYCSPSAQRILGYRPEELVGTNLLELVHGDDHELVRERMAQTLAEGEAFALARFRHRDGRWVELHGQARDLSASPVIGGILINGRDVTAAHAAAREATAVEQRYRELVERLPLAVYLRPTDSVTPTYMSPQMEELLGYPAERWVTEPELVHELLHPDDRTAFATWVAAGVDAPRHVEFRLRASDGRYVWVLNRRAPIRDASGAVVAYQGAILDITERKQLEEQLQQSQRLEALGLLAGGVAHDFNNLLTAISGYAELARRRLAEEEPARRDLDEVLVAASRAGDLTHQLLAFGRRQTLVTAVIDLNDVVARTERLLARAIDERIEVVCRLDAQLHLVRADAGQIEQVLVNLALNARDAMVDGGTLTIETENVAVVDESGSIPPGDYAAVSVTDTGHGFDAAVRERLFEPFFTTKEIGKGTGLGLAVVFGIVEQSRGYVLVESEAGVGSCFRVLLPRTHDPALPAPPAREVAPLPGSETVLLVEDEAIVRALTATMLEANGYRVLAAATPDEALAVDERYDLLLTDVVMPGMTGLELWQRLVERGRRPAVLFTSGYSAAAVADGATLPGELLEKPFSADQLAACVRAALDAVAVAA